VSQGGKKFIEIWTPEKNALTRGQSVVTVVGSRRWQKSGNPGALKNNFPFGLKGRRTKAGEKIFLESWEGRENQTGLGETGPAGESKSKERVSRSDSSSAKGAGFRKRETLGGDLKKKRRFLYLR